MKESKGGFFFQEEGTDGIGLYKTVDDTRSDLLDPGECVRVPYYCGSCHWGVCIS